MYSNGQATILDESLGTLNHYLNFAFLGKRKGVRKIKQWLLNYMGFVRLGTIPLGVPRAFAHDYKHLSRATFL